MDITKKMDMWLMSEAAMPVKLTPYGKSYIRLQDDWSKEELETLISKLTKNANGKKYEVSFAKGPEKKLSVSPLIIYRRGDDVVRHKMSDDQVKDFKKEMASLIKGTGLKVVGDGRSADWMSIIVDK